MLRACVQADQAAFVTRQAERLAAAGLSHDHKAWYQALRPLRPASKRVFKPWSKLTLEAPVAGTIAAPSEILDKKAAFFGAIEPGHVTTASELVAAASHRAVCFPWQVCS